MADGVVVKILGDDSDLQQKLKNGSVNVAKWAAATATAAAAAGVAVYASASSQIKDLTILANAANTSITNFQKMAYGAKLFGIEQDKLGDILKDVNDRIGDFNATGGGPMADFFNNIAPKVGVTADQFARLSGPEALQLYVSSLEKANLSQADMTFYMEAMASDSTRLIPLLKNNGAAMSELSAEAERLGITLSNVDAAKVENAGNSISKINSVIGGAANRFAVQFAPVVDAVADKIFGVAEESGGFQDAISGAYDVAITGAGYVADAFYAIEVAAAGVKVGVYAIAVANTTVVEAVVTGWSSAGNSIRSTINDIIDAANSIPGVNIGSIVVGESEALKTVQGWTQAAKDGLSTAKDELDAKWSEPLPSVGFKEWVKEAELSSAQAADAAAKARESIVVPSLAGGGQSDAELKKLKEETEARLQAIREANMSESELALEKYESDQEALVAARDLRLLTLEEYEEQERLTRENYEADRLEKAQKLADAEKKIADASAKAKYAITSSALGNLASLMDTENRKLFEIGKAAALAQATVDGYQAIVSSYAQGAKIGGPVVGAAYAATAAVATAVQIGKISSTSFGGGGGSSSASAGGGSAPATQEAQQSQNPAQLVNLNLQGDTFSRQSVESLIEELNEAVANGARIRVS